jgi:hypothetical protein
VVNKLNPQIKSTTENQKPQSHEVDLNQFRRWYAEDPTNREVKIEIKRKVDHTGSNLEAWVFQYFDDGDFALQRVWDVEEIDLEARYKKQLEEKYHDLKVRLGIVD